MIRRKPCRGVFLACAAVIALVTLPACNATGGHKWGSSRTVAPQGRVSMRPAYPSSRVKPLYLSGYAGAYYGPGR